MKIGIIGAGQIGSTLARKFSQVGHTVKLANSRSPSSLKEVASEVGATAVTAADAVKDVDVVIVAIPTKAIVCLESLFDGVPKNVVIIDTCNYYPFRDGKIDLLEQGTLESLWVCEQLGRPVVKAFNTISFQSLTTEGLPPGTDGRIALPVGGDDEQAKALVFGLVDAAGFDVVDAGGLCDSWRQQPGTAVYCTDYDANGVRDALSRADRNHSVERRDLASAKFFELPADTDVNEIVPLIRAITRSIFDPQHNK
ncbi:MULTISPECIES: NADPH-dependent F420 reductase [Pseudomonas]|uniref:NAD(P)-binding domain-containing protein n=1 Tax=Pseudomonas wuhanensis TaxID=2954098 RepID=A0ABY9GLG0_9PSED|nr:MULTISPECIES: NAD(P)-binding domain-containing protein [unclassified Pseudomonas]WLI10780.1 NAD(P)-binding domain-containing protein [Pseudomonas sp. FP603]WLI16602.1 NAD(P)-binding domain-containing protein [Pseudomonas sp. FP607]